MIDDYIEDLNRLLVSKEPPLVENVKLSTEEMLTCAGVLTATTGKWSMRRDVLTDLMLRLDNPSIKKILMFLDKDVIKETLPKC